MAIFIYRPYYMKNNVFGLISLQQVGTAPHTEIILVEDDTVEISSQAQQFRQ